MTKHYTPSGVPIPDNFNDGSAIPPHLWDDPGFADAITQPGVKRRVDEAVRQGFLSPQQANGLLVSLRLMRRHLNGDRSLPGEVLGRDDLPYHPLPFAPREGAPAERGTQKYDVMRAAVERLDADDLSHNLVHQMSNNDAPDVHQTIAERASAPPSLRESISGAVDALGG